MKQVTLAAPAAVGSAAGNTSSSSSSSSTASASTASEPAIGYVPDFSCRLLSEDVPFGLVATRGIAEILGVPTPCIDKVITWAQAKLGKEYLVNGKLIGKDVATSGAPQRFGVTRPDQLIVAAESVVAPVAAAAAAAATATAAVQALLLPAQRFVGSTAAAVQGVAASCADDREMLSGLRAQSCPVVCRPAVGSFTRRAARVCM
jgi:hypothetical protein